MNEWTADSWWWDWPDKHADTASTDNVSTSNITFTQFRQARHFFVCYIHCRSPDPNTSHTSRLDDKDINSNQNCNI